MSQASRESKPWLKCFCCRPEPASRSSIGHQCRWPRPLRHPSDRDSTYQLSLLTIAERRLAQESVCQDSHPLQVPAQELLQLKTASPSSVPFVAWVPMCFGTLGTSELTYHTPALLSFCFNMFHTFVDHISAINRSKVLSLEIYIWFPRSRMTNYQTWIVKIGLGLP